MKIFAYILVLAISTSASAQWHPKLHAATQQWYVINGSDEDPNTTWIKTKNKRTAKKLAKKLHKLEEEDGVWDDGSEYCQNPLNEC